MTRLVLGLAVLAAAMRIVFWAYTDRVWEDALITILHAENAVNGIGLTHFKVDEPPIHGFTSPLSVLIPLLGEVLHTGWGLPVMRLFSIAAGAATVVLAGLLLRRTPGMAMPAGLVALACGYLAIEHHQILWGMAGMETQVACAILLFSMYCYVKRDYRMLGVAAALCVLVRPDFAIWTVVVAAFLVADCIERRSLRPLAVTVGIAAAIYLPWILFATLYYGSPVPNTILAKSAGYWPWMPDSGSIFTEIRSELQRFHLRLSVLLGPSFGGHGTGFVPLVDLLLADAMTAMIGVSFVAAVWERRREILLMHGFFIAYALYYVFLVPIIFGWYAVPFAAVAILLAAHGIATLLRFVPDAGARSALAWAACVAYLGLFASFLPTTFRAERDIQALVEEPVRIAIGRYLHATPPDTTIAGEPLGFIGYYSKRTYYDYPGLASRRVVAYVRRSGNRDIFHVMREIQPDYLVLRPSDERNLNNHTEFGRWLRANYALDRSFSVPPADRARIFMAERSLDLDFVLMKHTSPRPEIVDTRRLGPALARVDPAVEGAWTPSGGFPGVPQAPRSASWWGSWSGNDANVGSVRFPLPPLGDAKEIAVPFLTGPSTDGLALRIVDAASGETLRQAEWLPVHSDRWAAWRVRLPEGAGRRSLALVAEDRGILWGQWLAVAAPHALDPSP
jgi:hypothetical protein